MMATRKGWREAAPLLGLHQPGSHGRIIEDAEPAAALGARHGACRRPGWRHTFLHRGTARLDGGAHRPPRARGHRLTPGKSDLTHDLRIDLPRSDALDIGGRMHQRQFTIAGRWRLGEPDLRQAGGDAIAQQPVLGHRKPVPRWQRKHELVGIERLHGRGRLSFSGGKTGKRALWRRVRRKRFLEVCL
jgi:hypothetical protein